MARPVRHISDIVSWVEGVIARTDLTTQIIDFACEVYLLVNQKIPFEHLQAKSDPIPTGAGVADYNLDFTTSGISATAAVAGIISIRYTQGTRAWRLKRSHVRQFDAIQYQTGVHPRSYARFATSIELMPAPPDTTGSFVVRYWNEQEIVNPTKENTIIETPEAWDALLRWETLFRTYYLIGQEDKAGLLVMPMPMPRQMSPKRTSMFEVGIIPRLWNDLLTTFNMREAVDEDFNINPIYRAYTRG